MNVLGSKNALADISLSAWPCHAFIRWPRFQMDPICRIHSCSSGGGGGTCMWMGRELQGNSRVEAVVVCPQA